MARAKKYRLTTRQNRAVRRLKGYYYRMAPKGTVVVRVPDPARHLFDEYRVQRSGTFRKVRKAVRV